MWQATSHTFVKHFGRFSCFAATRGACSCFSGSLSFALCLYLVKLQTWLWRPLRPKKTHTSPCLPKGPAHPRTSPAHPRTSPHIPCTSPHIPCTSPHIPAHSPHSPKSTPKMNPVDGSFSGASQKTTHIPGASPAHPRTSPDQSLARTD